MFCLICRHGLPRIVSPPTSVPGLGSVIPTPVSIIPVSGSVLPAKAGIQRTAFDPHSQGHLPLGKGTATIPCASALVGLPCILRMCISIRNSRD